MDIKWHSKTISSFGSRFRLIRTQYINSPKVLNGIEFFDNDFSLPWWWSLSKTAVIIIGNIRSQTNPNVEGKTLVSNQSPSCRPLITKTTGPLNMSRIRATDGIHFSLKWGWFVIKDGLPQWRLDNGFLSPTTHSQGAVARPEMTSVHEGQAHSSKSHLDFGLSAFLRINLLTASLPCETRCWTKKSRDQSRPHLLESYRRHFLVWHTSYDDSFTSIVFLFRPITQNGRHWQSYVISCWQLVAPQFWMNRIPPEIKTKVNDDGGRWSCSPGFASQTWWWRKPAQWPTKSLQGLMIDRRSFWP